MNFEKMANKIVAELNANGVDAYIWHIATTGSAYIRFKDNRIGSLRIADHNGRSKLKYKYNLRSDSCSQKGKWIKDDGTWRFYMHLSNWKAIIQILIERQKQVQNFQPSKFSYTIPHFKK